MWGRTHLCARRASRMTFDGLYRRFGGSISQHTIYPIHSPAVNCPECIWAAGVATRLMEGVEARSSERGVNATIRSAVHSHDDQANSRQRCAIHVLK